MSALREAKEIRREAQLRQVELEDELRRWIAVEHRAQRLCWREWKRQQRKNP